MDEDIGSWIQRACELSRNLEWSYRNNQPDDVVLRLIDDIVETLNGARERVASSRGVALEQEMIITGGSSGTRNYVQSVTHQLIQMQPQQIQAPRTTNTTTSRGALLIGEMAMSGGGREGSSDMEASPSSRRRKR